MTNTHLLPCPLCGTRARFFKIDDPDDRNFGGEGICCETAFCVSTDLRFSLMESAKPLLAETWNRRQDGCAALRAVIKHWDEFGPEHGMDELIDAARRSQSSAAQQPVAVVVSVFPPDPDGHGVNWLKGKRPKPGDLLYAAPPQSADDQTHER